MGMTSKPKTRLNRTPDQIEADRAEIARMLLRGKSIPEISAFITNNRNYSLSISAVVKEVKILREIWRFQYVSDISIVEAMELAKISELERAYWEGYERSMKDKITTLSEVNESNSVTRRSRPDGKYGEVAPYKSTKVTASKETRDGSEKWLAGVLSCIAQRCRILKIGIESSKAEEDWMVAAKRYGVDKPAEVFNELVKQFVENPGQRSVGQEDDPGSDGRSG